MHRPLPRSLFLIALGMLVACLAPASSMDLGTNFWNPGWHKPSDCFQNVKNVSGGNPWNPQFLKETAMFRSFRFMDWDNTNNSERRSWAQRPSKTTQKQNPVAYEWMIDLCNRQGADMWVTIPHRAVDHGTGDAPSDYALRLCVLVKTGVDMQQVDLEPLLGKLSQLTAEQLIAAGGTRTCEPLKPELKLFVEYSNETWNGIFKQYQYCIDQGTALGLDKDPRVAGYRYHAWAALRLFRAAELVFGENSPRVIKVLATHSANTWLAGRHQEVITDAKLNPWNIKASAIAIAPYFGHNVDGAAPDAVEQLRVALRKSAEQAARYRQIADSAGLDLIAYEGGQHVAKHAQALNRNPAMYELYQEYLREMAKSISHFCHYAHVGAASDRGAWGAIEYTGQPIEEAHKYRALVDWTKRPK